MAKATVQILVDDLDGSPDAETIRLGWNGDWRELDLSKRNLAALDRVLTKYWNAGRAVSKGSSTTRRRRRTSSRAKASGRDPKQIRAWANEQGIHVPARGRIPAAVEQQFNRANGIS
jgi:nucleoid-associated protein Lsr2